MRFYSLSFVLSLLMAQAPLSSAGPCKFTQSLSESSSLQTTSAFTPSATPTAESTTTGSTTESMTSEPTTESTTVVSTTESTTAEPTTESTTAASTTESTTTTTAPAVNTNVATNVVKNGDFANSLQYWSVQLPQPPITARVENGVVNYFNPASSNAMFFTMEQTLSNIDPSKTYSTSISARFQGAQSCRVDVLVDLVQVINSITPSSGDQDWTQFTGTHTPKANPAGVLRVRMSCAIGMIWVDNIAVVENTL
ncbi:hypothetical protein G7Z17_g1530 [Cylindrodendrum hubeiense]|uniref:CBM-cenC domain-containing protein n=1 Tax=Cylindrodendrum hubeiense TaxID=595255 RepID=A0A9P5LCD9_9HYPO|nr:hypothetical protein G7Z17_g1530 [Cylindrodendrum hubeiense]